MKKLNEFLQDLLHKFPKYTLTEQDKRTIGMGQRAEWITYKLLLKRFRKAKVAEKTRQDVLSKVSLSIAEDKPIYLIILFGGYKHFWNPSHPEVDWAELFNLNFMSSFCASVLAVHKPGVILDYGSEAVIMRMMDNYPETSLIVYAASFKKLIKHYSKCVPSNFKINYVDTGSKYDSEKLKKKIQEKLPEKKKQWKKFSARERKKRLHRSYRSFMWNGEEDLTTLNDAQRREKVEESKIIEDTFYEVEEEFLGDYFTGDNHIPLVLSWGLSDENIDHWLTLGSTYASAVDFWTGRGILEDRGERFIARVVSQSQYHSVRNSLKRFETDLVPLKNFRSIEVYKGELNFR